MTAGYEQRKEVAFNVGLFQAYFVAGLLNKVSDHFNKGDIKGCYHYLQSVRDRIHGDLKDAEAEKVNKTEEKIDYVWNKFQNAKNKNDFLKYKEAHFVLVRKYLQEIMTLMKICGYLPNKRDRTRLGF